MDRKQRILEVLKKTHEPRWLSDGSAEGLATPFSLDDIADQIIVALAAPDREPSPVVITHREGPCEHKHMSGQGNARYCLDCGNLVTTSTIKARPYSLKRRQ